MENENIENVWESAFDADSKEKIEANKKSEEIEDDVSDDLSILINFGRLTSTFDFWGHRFVIKTLKMNEELRASDLASGYSKNLDQGARALLAAIVAASIDTVDGMPLVSALGPTDETVIDRKYNYILENYYWAVVEHIYEKYAELTSRIDVALDEFKKK